MIIKVGIAILVIGTGPLLLTLIFGNVNSNPVIFGVLSMVTFWPSIALILIGLAKTLWDRRKLKMKNPQNLKIKTFVLYIVILLLLLSSYIVYSMALSETVGPTTDLNFTCTGLKGLQWNCSFWNFFHRNVIIKFFTHYVIYFTALSMVTILGIHKGLTKMGKKQKHIT